ADRPGYGQGYEQGGQRYEQGDQSYGQGYGQGYDQHAPYPGQEQAAYETPRQPAYDEQYYAPNGGLPQDGAYSPADDGGYPQAG
ncbi:hypothetical protein NGM37_04650, partial [Streptomyces sp. TRM76130]|nr:hypothetical protein [Streptomyces sp. TRM76130]